MTIGKRWTAGNPLRNEDAITVQGCILAGGFNLVFGADEERGASAVMDPFLETFEDPMQEWDPMDVKLKKGKYFWTNRRIGSGHIAARLDWFPVNKELQLENLEITSKLVPFGVSHHKSHLSLKQTQNYGPLLSGLILSGLRARK